MSLLPVGPGAWWVAVCGFLIFACLPLSQAGAEVLVRTRVDNAQQARTWGTISLVTQTGYLVAYLCSGALVDHVLQPLVEPGQSLSTSLGAVVGTGPGRGAAAARGAHWARPWPWWPSPFVSSDVGSPDPATHGRHAGGAPMT